MKPIDLQKLGEFDTTVLELGTCDFRSPVRGRPFVADDQRVMVLSDPEEVISLAQDKAPLPTFQIAGPREAIFHDPAKTKAAIVTCGGLCPGLNDVIKGLVHVLQFDYGVTHVLGIRYGYRGLNPSCGHEPVRLTAELVDHIHEVGGTILGSSRGKQDEERLYSC